MLVIAENNKVTVRRRENQFVNQKVVHDELTCDAGFFLWASVRIRNNHAMFEPVQLGAPKDPALKPYIESRFYQGN